MKQKTILIAALLMIVSCKGGDSARFQTDRPREPLKEYTKDDPGEWAGLEDQHYPRVTIDNHNIENVIIQVNFPIKHEPDHYIEKVGIMDKDGRDIVVRKFNPTADYWGARFVLSTIPEGAKAFARCSLHDLWTAPLEEKKFFGWF